MQRRGPSHLRPVTTFRLEMLEAKRLLAGFDITLVIDPDLAASANVFQAAAHRWERAITADIPNVGSGAWGAAVDDIRIDVAASEVDGPGGTLGYADLRYRRAGTNLPINGILNIDTADLGNSSLLDIATHEIGHLLGIGSLWTTFGLVTDYGGTNPQYTGAGALAQYRAYAGNAALASVPVENTGAMGTRDVHWREATYGRELMTGFYNGGSVNPLSRISIASLIDLGYPGVDPNAADAYNLTGGNPIPTVTSLTASAATSLPNASLTLTANNVADVTGGVSSVRFYRETNGLTGLQNAGNVSVMDTLVGTVNVGPFATTISLSGLPEGSYTYYAQVTDALGAVSTVVAATNVISSAPPVPAMPTLAAGSDSGISNGDRITNVALPTILGATTAPAGTTIRVFADGAEIGQTTTVTGGGWSFTPATPLANGARSITAVAQGATSSSAPSAPLVVTIDTVAPQVTASAFVYVSQLGVTFTFSEDVAPTLDAGDVTFRNTTTSTDFAGTLADYTANVARFGFAEFPTSAGNYTATLAAGGVTDVAGNLLAGTPGVSFFYLPGDVNRDRTVDFADLLVMAQNYGRPATYATGDVDYDGRVNFNDLLLLSQNYGRSLAVAAPAAAGMKPATATKRPTAGILA